jgi:23S rRNA pseudouridine1911/1915/1917 synthase
MARTPPIEILVPATLVGERLDRAMAALAPGVSRGEARRLIAAGVVFVDGKRTGIQSRVVRLGERLSWEVPAVPFSPATGGYPRIVVDRPEMWIIDKPAGMPVEATRHGTRGTLDEWLSRALGPAYLTHRLDTATSGLIVVARTLEAQAQLNRLFATHAITRRYLAVVTPAPSWSDLTMDAPLDDRAAVTHARVAVRSAAAAALEVRLQTGRTRQIRRHLAGAGFPVVGETETGARVASRLLLHAFALSVPWDGPGPATPPPLPPLTSMSTSTAAITATAPPPAGFLEDAQALGLGAGEIEALVRE